MAADEQLSEEDLDMLESTMRMALGNFEQFNGAPYIKRITDRLVEKNIPFTLSKVYNHGDAVCFPWSDGDVVCHHGSYGHKLGLFEFLGADLLTPEDRVKRPHKEWEIPKNLEAFKAFFGGKFGV